VVEVGEGHGVGIEVDGGVEAGVQAEDVQLGERGVGVRPAGRVRRLRRGRRARLGRKRADGQCVLDNTEVMH
jgi:hypothetical protein